MSKKQKPSAPDLTKRILTRLASKRFPRGAALLEFPANPKPRYGWGAPPHVRLHDMFESQRTSYRRRLESFLKFRDRFLEIPRSVPRNSTEPMWDNAMMPALDAIALYSTLATEQPRRYLEIGAGHSTRFARRAVEDRKLSTNITCIDPAPGVSVDTVADAFIRSPLEDVGPKVFEDLSAGDILFIDSSHRVLMNSDVTLLFLEVLPSLKRGVFVHFHDIFLPYDYPPDWGCRYYSEQYLLATYLLAGDRLSVHLPNAFISHDKELIQTLSPIWSNPHMKNVAAHGASFWAVVE